MKQNKVDLIINIIVLFFLISVLLNIYEIISNIFSSNFRMGFGMITALISLSLMSSITYLLFKRNKIGWYLAIGNSIIIIILTIINLFSYKVYLGSIGILTFGEFLANKKELSSMLKYLTTSVIFNVIIIYILLKKNIKNQFLKVNQGN